MNALVSRDDTASAVLDHIFVQIRVRVADFDAVCLRFHLGLCHPLQLVLIQDFFLSKIVALSHVEMQTYRI